MARISVARYREWLGSGIQALWRGKAAPSDEYPVNGLSSGEYPMNGLFSIGSEAVMGNGSSN
jgi:hypothetical protein